MIELTNVTKYFKTNEDRNYILNNVYITLPKKNIGILGRNGAGKSTLMRMLGGIEFPNKGKIYSEASFSWPLGLRGGFVGNLSGRENVKFVSRLYGKEREEIKEIVEYVKEFSELGNYFDMPIKTYSSGMKSRLGFGLSLSMDFDYMLIDETLSVGDSRFKKKAKNELLKKIESCHIILVSHNMKTLKELCDVGILLENGEMHFYENIEEAVNAYEETNKKGKK